MSKYLQAQLDAAKALRLAYPNEFILMCPHPKKDGWPCRFSWPESKGTVCPVCGKDVWEPFDAAITKLKEEK